MISSSGTYDIDEDVETGYGGDKILKVFKQDGFFELAGLFYHRT